LKYNFAAKKKFYLDTNIKPLEHTGRITDSRKIKLFVSRSTTASEKEEMPMWNFVSFQ